MAWHNDLGNMGEEAAFRYLEKEGFTILERNWRIGRREVDFIALDGDELVVVEVKTRSSREEYPEEILSRPKQRRLIAAGAAYLAQHKIRREIRFDLILLTGPGLEIEHIRNAFDTFDNC